MKKTLATLWLAWMLAWSPSANAQIDSSKNEIKKDLLETMVQDKAEPGEYGKTISFENAEKSYETQQLFEEVMKDEKIQELISEYWQEEVEKTVSEIITSKEGKKIMEKILEDEKVQKALEEWDHESVEKRVQEIAEEILYWFEKVREIKLVSTVCGILMGIYIRKICTKDY